MRHANDRHPNFYADGHLYLVRCFACGGERGTENWALAVATGRCAFCGWEERGGPRRQPAKAGGARQSAVNNPRRRASGA